MSDEYRVCRICGKFLPSYHFSCDDPLCDKCRGRGLKTQWVTDYRECAICGELFDASITGRKLYCSDECREASTREYARGRFLILKRDGFQCFYCGKSSYRDRSRLHVDHVIPRHSGGESTAVNLVAACQQCNIEKGKIEIDEIKPLIEEIQRRNKRAGIRDDQIIKLSRMDARVKEGQG